MVPASFTLLDRLPFNLSGKIDRAALPTPKLMVMAGSQAETDIERRLSKVWCKVLGLKQVGIDSQFFALGGNSIAAIKLTAAMSVELGREIPLSLLLDHPTIAALARNIDSYSAQTIIPRRLGESPQSFAQQRLWFIEQYEQGSSAYLIHYWVELEAGADVQRIADAVNHLAKRHPILKTVFFRRDNLLLQRVLDCPIPLTAAAFGDEADLAGQVKTELDKPFDLTREPALRLNHYQGQDKQYLLFAWHHIAFDGWSTELFFDELAQLLAGDEHALAPVEIDYFDFVHWQREYLSGDRLAGLLKHWKGELTDWQPLILPTDRPRPARFDYRGDVYQFSLPRDLSDALKAKAKAHGVSLYTLMLSGFYLTLSALSGQDDIVIGSPSDNREQRQTQQLVGFFVNALAMRCRIDPKQSLAQLVAMVHQVVNRAKAHQALPFEQLVDELGLERDPTRHSLFQVMFTLQEFGRRLPESLPFKARSLTELEGIHHPAKFDLLLFITAGGDCIEGELSYGHKPVRWAKH